MEELREEIAKRLFMDNVRAKDGDISWRNASVAVRGAYMMRAVPFLNLFEEERYVILAEDQLPPELPGCIKGWPEILHEIYIKAGFRKMDIQPHKASKRRRTKMKYRYRITFEATPETTYEIEAEDMEEAYRKAKTMWMGKVIKEKIDRLAPQGGKEEGDDNGSARGCRVVR